MSTLRSDVAAVLQALLTPAMRENGQRILPITTWEVVLRPRDINDNLDSCVQVLDRLPNLHDLIADFGWLDEVTGSSNAARAHNNYVDVKALRIQNATLPHNLPIVLRLFAVFPMPQHLSISRSVIDSATLAQSVLKLSSSLTQLDLEHGLPGGDLIAAGFDFSPILRVALPKLRDLSLRSYFIELSCLQTLAVATGFPALTNFTMGSYDGFRPPYSNLRNLLSRGQLPKLKKVTLVFMAVTEGHDEEWAGLRASFPSVELCDDFDSHFMRWHPTHAAYHRDESYATFRFP